MATSIRVASGLDRDAVRDVHLSAFTETENQVIAMLAARLLSEETYPETINLVAEMDGEIVGHIAFSPVTADADTSWLGYILAPLGVRPEYQRVGIGARLIESGMKRLSETGVDSLLVYGDPKYYGRFGFSAETALGYRPPYALQYPFGWQAVLLREQGSDGRVIELSCVEALRDPALW